MVADRYKSEEVDPALLGEELKFRCGRVAKNRFMKYLGKYQYVFYLGSVGKQSDNKAKMIQFDSHAGMTERISTWDLELPKRGIPTERVVNLYEKWGHGGFGLIMTGNVPVCPVRATARPDWFQNHMEFAGNTLVCKENDSEELRSQMKRCSSALKADGALAILQLTHAGRLTPFALNPAPFSSSDVQFEGKDFFKCGKPVALSLEQIQEEVVDRFVYAAKIARETGFDGVQIYAAHGWLLSQFMSPQTNKRIDHYGGPPENRARIILEIYDAIRKEIPQKTGFILGMKTNSVEFQDQGLQVEDAKIICQLMEEKGFDFVELSGGTIEKPAFVHERESTKKREAFFLEFAQQIRPVFKNTVVYVTGGFRTVGGMVAAVHEGITDGIGLGRPSAAEPDLPKKLLSGKVAGAVKDAFDQNNFTVTAVAANAQMALGGKRSLRELNGQVTGDIPDFSNQTEAEAFQLFLGQYFGQVMQLAAEDKPVTLIPEYVAVCEVKE